MNCAELEVMILTKLPEPAVMCTGVYRLSIPLDKQPVGLDPLVAESHTLFILFGF